MRDSPMTNATRSTHILQPLATTRKALGAERQRRKRENRLALYVPYPKQAEFHAAGATYRERSFMAGNQLGKTLSGSAEAAIHLTGRYPDWWGGRVFDRPVRA